MKYCPTCRTEYEDWVKLCADCKVSLVTQLRPEKKPESAPTNCKKGYTKKCPKCGKVYDDSWNICLHCQLKLSEDLSVIETNPELREKVKIKSAELLSNPRKMAKHVLLYAIIHGVIINFGLLLAAVFIIVRIRKAGGLPMTPLNPSILKLPIAYLISDVTGLLLLLSECIMLHLNMKWAEKITFAGVSVIALTPLIMIMYPVIGLINCDLSSPIAQGALGAMVVIWFVQYFVFFLAYITSIYINYSIGRNLIREGRYGS